jgi:hypothetical protein
MSATSRCKFCKKRVPFELLIADGICSTGCRLSLKILEKRRQREEEIKAEGDAAPTLFDFFGIKDAP